MNKPVWHVAAPYTFAHDKFPACLRREHAFASVVLVTHVLADVTCARCQRTVHYRDAVARGWTDSDQATVSAAMATIGKRGGLAAAQNMSAKARVARARKAGLASTGGGWPKGKKRGPSPLKGRKVAPKVVR